MEWGNAIPTTARSIQIIKTNDLSTKLCSKSLKIRQWASIGRQLTQGATGKVI